MSALSAVEEVLFECLVDGFVGYGVGGAFVGVGEWVGHAGCFAVAAYPGAVPDCEGEGGGCCHEDVSRESECVG